jgi:SAM-dependent methyltransferase
VGINTGENEISVYIDGAPIEVKSRDPLYRSAREWLERHMDGGAVLDFGCSNGVATYGLDPRLTVFGIDLDSTALEAARKHNPDYRGVQSSMQDFGRCTLDIPFGAGTTSGVSEVLLLDVLEHAPRQDSADFLNTLRISLNPNHALFVSMPLISPASVETLRGLAGIVKNRKRPEGGLFDRTHEILTGRKGHLRLLRAGGYTVTEEYETNRMEGITGKWDWKDAEPITPFSAKAWAEEHGHPGRLGQAAGMVYGSLRRFYDATHRQESRLPGGGVSEALTVMQGVYVARPIRSVA